MLQRELDVTNDEDEWSIFAKEEEDSMHNGERGVKRRIDWTTVLDDIAGKCWQDWDLV